MGGDEEKMNSDRKRYVTFIACLLAALSAGTNYSFSSYAPQLSHRLHLSSTSLNLIGFAGSLGNYSFSPVFGSYVDKLPNKRSKAIGMLLSSFLLVTGYGGTFSAFLGYLDSVEEGKRLGLLIVLGYLTGAGAASASVSALSLTANSFPRATRATAAASVLAAFALSALFYTSLGHLLPNPKAQSYLGLLTTLPAFFQLVCWGTIRIVNRDEESTPLIVEDDRGGYERVVVAPIPYNDISDIEDDVFDEDEDDEVVVGSPTERQHLNPSSPLIPHSRSTSIDILDARSPPTSHHRLLSHSETVTRSRSRSHDPKSHHHTEDIGGFQLLKRIDFWMLFLIFLVLSGTGLMYINNVGTIVHELTQDTEQAEKWQGMAVGAISLFNCIGRAMSGYLTDHLHAKFQLSRSTFLFLPPLLFLISISYLLNTAAIITSSCLMGLSYGSLFAIGPLLTMEWFGLRNWTLNMGLLLLSPIPGSNIFSLLFGHLYDLARGKCVEMQCFEPTLLTARGAAVGAFALATWVFIRRRKADRRHRIQHLG